MTIVHWIDVFSRREYRDIIVESLNYCIKELKKKGLIKIKNFQNNPSKSNYLYLLTPKGFSVYTKLTINFMSRKIIEYEELEKELNKKDVDSN